uniref:Uncharacterized protein n=1 Tax=Octopus bimaculoides TaxID=37653 RepID=A0A0L8HQ85_OCTBM
MVTTNKMRLHIHPRYIIILLLQGDYFKVRCVSAKDQKCITIDVCHKFAITALLSSSLK